VLVNKSASKKERKKERKTARRRLPPHRILKLLPYRKQQSFPVATKIETAPSLLLLSTTPKTTAPVTIAEIAKMRLKNLLRNLFVRNVSSLTPALSPSNNFSSEKTSDNVRTQEKSTTKFPSKTRTIANSPRNFVVALFY
jgi:hypothetical protein